VDGLKSRFPIPGSRQTIRKIIESDGEIGLEPSRIFTG
jgi:hypothetical protein